MREVTIDSAVSSVMGSSWFMYIGNRLQACRFSVRAAGVSATKNMSNLPVSASLAISPILPMSVEVAAYVSGCSHDAGW